MKLLRLLLLGLASTTVAVKASAEEARGAVEPAASASAAVVSGRFSAGLGGGGGGVVGRLGAELDGWLGESLGVGAFALIAEQAKLLDARTNYWGAGPVLALRSSEKQSYWFGSLGVGYVSGIATEAGDWLCWSGCSEPTRERFDGILASLSGGLIGKLGVGEIGGVLTLDVMSADTAGTGGGSVAALTANVTWGLGAN